MKSAIAASLLALSLAACSSSDPGATNPAGNEVALNEADFPAEGGAGNEEGGATLGFDNILDHAGAGNAVVANDAVAANLR